MYRILFRFTVTTLTILTANLLTTAISDYLVTLRYVTKPLRFTLIGMLVIVIVFYPLFIKLEKWAGDFSVRMVKSGKNLAGKYAGLLLVLLSGLLVLFYFYARMWYDIDLLGVLMSGDIGTYL